MKISNRNDVASMNASFTSAAYHIEHLIGYSICGTWAQTAATLSGLIKLQASNNAFMDNVNNEENPDATWVDITGSSIAVSGSGDQFWNVSDAYYKAFRIVWVRSGGQGTYTAFITAKGVI